MDDRIFLLDNGYITADEVIKEALKQEAEGVKPWYKYIYDFNKNELSPAGWLIASSYKSGVIMVYRRSCDGKMIIVNDWPAYFCAG